MHTGPCNLDPAQAQDSSSVRLGLKVEAKTKILQDNAEDLHDLGVRKNLQITPKSVYRRGKVGKFKNIKIRNDYSSEKYNKKCAENNIVSHILNHSPREAETGRSEVQGHG